MLLAYAGLGFEHALFPAGHTPGTRRLAVALCETLQVSGRKAQGDTYVHQQLVACSMNPHNHSIIGPTYEPTARGSKGATVCTYLCSLLPAANAGVLCHLPPHGAPCRRLRAMVQRGCGGRRRSSRENGNASGSHSRRGRWTISPSSGDLTWRVTHPEAQDQISRTQCTKEKTIHSEEGWHTGLLFFFFARFATRNAAEHLLVQHCLHSKSLVVWSK